MINQVMEFEETQGYEAARQRFIELCGFHLEKEKHQKMMAQAADIREEGLGGIRLRALVSKYDRSIIDGKTMTIEGVTFYCDALSQICTERVQAVYPYIVTAGECTLSERPILELLYADLWGTAYADVVRRLLMEALRKDMCSEADKEGDELFLSDSMGPGYFGMPTEEVRKFFEILDAEKIGVKVRESGLMVPLKSCAGFVLSVSDMTGLPRNWCKDCLGNAGGCTFCSKRTGQSPQS